MDRAFRPRRKVLFRTATYSTTFELPSDFAGPDRLLRLDLGRSQSSHGSSSTNRTSALCGNRLSRWRVTKAAVPGPNRLEIQVANLWVNRLIGDSSCRRTVNGVRPICRAGASWRTGRSGLSRASPAPPAASRSPPGSAGPKTRPCSSRASWARFGFRRCNGPRFVDPTRTRLPASRAKPPGNRLFWRNGSGGKQLLPVRLAQQNASDDEHHRQPKGGSDFFAEQDPRPGHGC